jgi:hypothetical protein
MVLFLPCSPIIVKIILSGYFLSSSTLILAKVIIKNYLFPLEKIKDV